MRFTWIALPILLTTLAPAAPAETVVDDRAEDEKAALVGTAATHVPLEIRPASPGEAEVAQPSETSARRLDASQTTAEEDAGGDARTPNPTVRLRALQASCRDFSSRLSHSLTGFLSSYSTACPPPARF